MNIKKSLIAAAFLACLSGNAMADDGVSTSVLGSASGTSWTMNVSLTNDVDYVAFQMDVTLPQGVTLGDCTATDRMKDGKTVTIDGASESTNFIIASNCIDATNNIYRIIAYNYGNVAISGTSGDKIFSAALSSSIAKDIDDITITTSNVIFVTEDNLKGVSLEGQTINGSLIGDINKSGNVNANDLTAMVDIIIRGKASSSYATYDLDAADLNTNGIVNANDLTLLVQKIITNK